MRSADEVAIRLLCLAAVVARANTEELLESNQSAPLLVGLTGGRISEVPSKLNQWLLREELVQGLSPQERAWMNIPVGRWSERDKLDAWWRREGLMVLLWSTQAIKSLPGADTQIDLEDLLRSACLLKGTLEFRRSAKLRDSEEISRARSTAEFWLWRARTTQLQESEESLTDPRISREKLQVVIKVAAEAGERDGLFKRIKDDFPCFGKSFSELDNDEWSLIHSIATERLYALNWLCNEEQWDDVETNT